MTDLASIVGLWTNEQLRCSLLANFEDDRLSFSVSSSSDERVEKPAADEFKKPRTRHIDLTDFAIANLARVGGLDISFSKDGTYAVATLVVLSFPDMKVIASKHHKTTIAEPYIPSYLSMRESKPFKAVIEQFRADAPEQFPEVFLVDGNGRLHDRSAGSATVIGVLLDIPTVGIAKEYYPLSSDPDSVRSSQKAFKAAIKPMLQKRGDWVAILNGSGNEVVGSALSTATGQGTRPIFVSSGHRVSLQTAMQLALACTRDGRLPEPVRQADLLSRSEIKFCACGITVQ